MQTRRLGRSELEVPVVVFGAWAIGGWYWGPTDDDEAIRAIRASIDAGANAIDTAPVYGFGHSETVVGRAIAGLRERAIVMTKLGLRWDDERGEISFETVDQEGQKRVVRRNARPWSVKDEVHRSLARMKIERIDLLQVHWPDPQTPVNETLGAMLDLRDAGKIREIGVSNFTVEMLRISRIAMGETPLASLQPKYSLLARDIEKDVLPYCREAGIGVVAYSPLEQGLLSGRVGPERTFAAEEGRSKRPTFQAANRARVNEVLERVARPIAERHGATIAQVAVAWVIAQPGVTSAIVGARTAEQARENARAGEVRLDAGEVRALREAFERLKLDLPRKKGLKALLSRAARKLRGA